MVTPNVDITVSGKQVELSDALQTHVTQRFETVVRRLPQAAEVRVTFSRARTFFTCDITMHMRGAEVHVDTEAETAYQAFDRAAEHVAHQLASQRWRRRDLRRHHMPDEMAVWEKIEPEQQ